MMSTRLENDLIFHAYIKFLFILEKAVTVVATALKASMVTAKLYLAPFLASIYIESLPNSHLKCSK